MNFYFLLVTCVMFVYACALECEFSDEASRENLSRSSKVCFRTHLGKSKKDVRKDPDTVRNEPETLSESSDTIREVSDRVREDSGSVHEDSNESGERKLHHAGPYRKYKRHTRSREGTKTESVESDEDILHNDTNVYYCIVNCMFERLNLANEKGYPDHSKVSQAILRNIRSPEVRDFMQDSVDECFQLMDQGDRMDACMFSSQLVKCMGEKAKSNCSDWPILDLRYHRILSI